MIKTFPKFTMHSPKRIKITDVNPHLICVLCGGYYIDATTVIECLHSFCKSCIVRYLEKNKYCPICDVQIHKTSPLLSIRSDRALQNIVYKLVPSLFKNEMERRVKFYEKNPGAVPTSSEDRGEVNENTSIFTPDELLVVCLDYFNEKSVESVPKRYLHCPAALPLSHLIKLIRGKFNLSSVHQVNLFFKDDPLPENITVMDVAYTYQCKRKTPINLSYRILEFRRTTIRLLEVKAKKEDGVESSAKEETHVDGEWKEVQLQISENGVMSVRNMNKSECSPKPAEQAPICDPACTSAPSTHPSANMSPAVASTSTTKPSSSNGPIISLPSELTTTLVPSNYTSTPARSSEPIVSVIKVTKDQVKKESNHVEANKFSISRVPAAAGFKEKGDALNKIVSKLSPNERVIGNTSVTIRPVLPGPKTQIKPKDNKIERKPAPTVRYKTLTSPTKQWNPSIDRTTMLSLMQNSDSSKPPRFFKMRNMPRYLGNPASGVKPMFVGAEEPKERRSPTKLPPPYAPGSPRNCKFPDKIWPSRVPSPAHTGTSIFHANPYHLLYSGFPGPFNPDNLLAGASPELIRSMCASTAFHPSLPPSISMLFNPLHGLSRPAIESPVAPRVPMPGKAEEKSLLPILPAPQKSPVSPTKPAAVPTQPSEASMSSPPAPPQPQPKPVQMDSDDISTNNNIDKEPELAKPKSDPVLDTNKAPDQINPPELAPKNS